LTTRKITKLKAVGAGRGLARPKGLFSISGQPEERGEKRPWRAGFATFSQGEAGISQASENRMAPNYRTLSV